MGEDACPARRRPPRSQRHGAGDPFSKPQPPLDCPFCFLELKFYFPCIYLFLNFLLWKSFKYTKIETLMPRVPVYLPLAPNSPYFFFPLISAVQHLVSVRYSEADLRYHIWPVKISMYVSNR